MERPLERTVLGVGLAVRQVREKDYKSKKEQSDIPRPPSRRDKELLSARVRNEGEFWMAFDDFARQFSHLDLVQLSSNSNKNIFPYKHGK